MARCHLVRVGALGQVGRFVALDAVRYPRACRVVVRTERGLELGEVLAPGEDLHRRLADGAILRAVTPEDELLEERLARYRQQACEACAKRLPELRLPVTLMDVELLFDGQTLVFYFLGQPSEELEQVVAELADVYEARAQVRRFAETLTAGCGPECGTAEAGGCSSCTTGCAVAAACGVRR